MQSGLGADYGGSWAEQHLPLANEQLTERLTRPVIAAAQPGQRYMYSNLGYVMLGRVISAAAGCDARDFIVERFIKPLGMASTSWSPHPLNAATGYCSMSGRLQQDHVFAARNDGAVFGGLWSSVPDLAVWIDFLCSAHAGSSDRYDRLLRRASRLEMQRASVLRPIEPCAIDQEPPPCRAYGFGLVNFQGRTEWTVGHGGAVPGFGTHVQWSPATGEGVIAMANLRYADLSGLCHRVLDLVSAAAPRRATTVHPRVAQRAAELLTLIKEWNSAAARSLFTPSFFVDYPEQSIARRFAELRDACGDVAHLAISSGAGLSAVVAEGDRQLFTFTISTIEPGAIQELVFAEEPV
jgi:CubicO group peptidase (beta-lactamase class C family)